MVTALKLPCWLLVGWGIVAVVAKTALGVNLYHTHESDGLVLLTVCAAGVLAFIALMEGRPLSAYS